MKNFILLFLLHFSVQAFAQVAGNTDTTFNPDNFIHGILCSSLQSDGRIIIGGNFTSVNYFARNRVARLNADGSLDMSFNPGQGAETPGKSPGLYNAWVKKICIQPDGKIIVVGSFSSYNGTSRNHIARLNTDGTLDNSFKPGVGPDDFVETLVIQTDGKIIIGGHFKSYNGTTRNGIARLNTDGSLDMSFDPGKGANDNVCGAVIQPDGKIIIGGYFNSYDGVAKSCVARLNTDGSLDSSFNTGKFELINKTPFITTVLVQPDGRIIVGGAFTSYDGKYCTSIVRLNADGSLENNFDLIQYESWISVVDAIALQSDGKIVICGFRLNADGGMDKCYFHMPAGMYIKTILIQPDGEKIYGGGFGYGIIRMNADPYLSPPTADAQSFCNGAKVANLVAKGNSVKWYTSATGGSALASNDVLSTATYYVSQMAMGCERESERTAVPVTISAPVIPTFSQPNPICSGTELELPTVSDNGVTGIWSPEFYNSKTTTYTFTPTAESCAATTTIAVVVYDLPDTDADYTKVICSGSNEDVQLNAGLLSGSQSDYTYEWFKDGELLPSVQSYNLNAETDGVYECVVKDKISGCEKTRTITVAYSEEAIIKDVEILDLRENNTVIVISSSAENSEYCLDNPGGPFQDSNVFENVEPGIHTVYMNDKNGCGLVSKTIAVVGAPPFFTPNGDGFNDRWKLQGIDGTFYKNLSVEIFDRFGKLLKVLPAETNGWDGTYNGHPEPSNDYWFVVNLEDGRVAKGHFSLIR